MRRYQLNMSDETGQYVYDIAAKASLASGQRIAIASVIRSAIALLAEKNDSAAIAHIVNTQCANQGDD